MRHLKQSKQKAGQKRWMGRVSAALLLATLLFSSAIAIAAAVSDTFPVSYRTGTTDTVTGMPEEGQAAPGQTYSVSSARPQREGYEFIEWILEWEEASAATGYTVHYVDTEGNKVAEDKVVADQKVGSTVTEEAISVSGYRAKDPSQQSITLAEGTNEITFVYNKTYRIYYDAGVGTGTVPVDTKEYLPGEEVIVKGEDSDLLVTKGEYIFFWSIRPFDMLVANGEFPEEGEYYESGQVLLMPEHDVTLYALYSTTSD